MAMRMIPKLCSSICFLVKVLRGLCRTKFLMSCRPRFVAPKELRLASQFGADVEAAETTSITFICNGKSIIVKKRTIRALFSPFLTVSLKN